MAKPKSGQKRYTAAAVCAPGLEDICSQELKALGLRPKPAGPGLLEFTANARQVYAANVWLRTASRVVVRLATFRATDFEHLQQHASQIDWGSWIGDGLAPKFRISSNESKLYHTKAIAQRLHQVSRPPSTGESEQLFIVRIDRNTVTISVDSSGAALHHRPWRTQLGEAPLRTTMAVGLLLAAEWDFGTSLVDPFCGSGTIAIEGALMAAGLPPGGAREFAFHHWPQLETGAWASVAGTVDAAQRRVEADPTLNCQGGPMPTIVASDSDEAMVAMAQSNAAAAEVSELIEIDQRSVSHLRARSDTGLVAANPPYGKRMGTTQVGGLYRRLGVVCRDRFPTYDLALITSNSKLARMADGNLASRAKFRHGGLPVQIYFRSAQRAERQPAEDETITKLSPDSVVKA